MNEGTNWHGWARSANGVYTYKQGACPALHIGYLPRRGHPALYIVENGTTTCLAYFVSEDAAKRAMKMIDHMTEARTP